jgi:hypothetical protein
MSPTRALVLLSALSATGLAASRPALADEVVDTEAGPAAPAAAVQAKPEEPALETVVMGFDLVPGVGQSGASRGGDRRHLSIGGITWAGAVDGIELSVVGALTEHELDGFQATGGVNLVAGSVDGFQGAGGLNVVAGGLDGFQGAGGVNIVAESVDGVQLAGGVNLVRGSVDGFQGAGGVNVAAGSVDGVQAAGGVNLADGVDGSQIAPVNVSTDDVDGVQIGVVNVARNSDVSLGLINIIYEGRTHVDAWTTEAGFMNAALKHGGRYFHYIYGAGWRPDGACSQWALTLGVGGHAPLTDRLFLDGDVLVSHLSPREGFLLATNELATGRAVAGIQLFDRLALTGGLSYNMLFSSVQDGSRYARNAVELGGERGTGSFGWTGWHLGVQVF